MKNKGFTLIELMLVIGIIAILAAIAIPNFTAYLQKSRRADAHVALNELQQSQAKLRANCRWYAESIGSANDCSNTAAASVARMGNAQGDGTALTENGYYTIAITAGTASGNAYTATATPVAGGKQSSDNTCQLLRLTVNTTNPNGLKSAVDSNGNDSSDKCW